MTNKGDLISREALKREFEKVYPLATNEMGGVVNKDIYDIIDNAPTVDISREVWNQSNALLEKRLTYLERPQGEWIKKVDDVGFISHICSECGAEIELEDPCDNKFCWNCGAEMKSSEVVMAEQLAAAKQLVKETTFDEYLEEQLKDAEFKKEWENLCDEDTQNDGAD